MFCTYSSITWVIVLSYEGWVLFQRLVKRLRQCLAGSAGVGGSSLCVSTSAGPFPPVFPSASFFPSHLFLFSSLHQILSQTHTHTHTAVALRRKALINLTVWVRMWEWEIRRETEREILTEGGNTRAGERWDYWNPWAHQPYSWVERCHKAVRTVKCIRSRGPQTLHLPPLERWLKVGL